MAVNASVKDYALGMVGVMLFFVLFMQFAINIGDEYNLTSDDMGGEYLDYDNILGNLSGVSAQGEAWREGFEQEDPAEPDLTSGVNIQYIWGTLKLMFDFLVLPFTLLSTIIVNVTKVPEIVANVAIFGLIVGMVLAIWRALRAGE